MSVLPEMIMPEQLSPTPIRIPYVSWFCAISPFLLLLLFITLGIHIRLGLGRWPAPMFEDYHTPAFDFHRRILSSFHLFAFFGAGPLWVACLLVQPLRPTWPRMVVAQLAVCGTGWLLIFGTLTFDPTTFSAWFLD